MKTYDDVATTPLKFHKFYKYIMPLLGANALANLILGIKTNGFASTGMIIDYVYDAIVVICVIIGVYGSLYWKPSGWVGIMALQVSQVVYAVVAYVMLQVTNNLPDKMLQQMALKVLLPILIAVYYFKRKGIFFNTVVMKVSKQAVKRSEKLEDEDYELIEASDEESEDADFEVIEAADEDSVIDSEYVEVLEEKFPENDSEETIK